MQGNLGHIRKSIINQLANHIPFEGWTDRSVRQAFSDVGLDYGLYEVIFPKGYVSIMVELVEIINSEFLESLNIEILQSMGVRQKIGYIITKKLETAMTYKEILQTGISTLLIKDKKLILRMLWNDADKIWRMVGDKSLDYNYYSKRSLLSIVLVKTVMYWLQDKSVNNESTIKYLYATLDEMVKFGQMLGKFKDFGKMVTKIPFIRLLFIK